MRLTGNLRLWSAIAAISLLNVATIPGMVAFGESRGPITPTLRITEDIDESSLVTLHGNTHPLAEAQYDRGPSSTAMLAERLILVLERSAQQEAALQTYLASLQDSHSMSFRQWMTPEEFGKRFGVSDGDLVKVQGWLQGHGLTVNKVAKSRMEIEFSGTVGQVQTAFHTSIHSYAINGKQYWANASDPQIPKALAPVVAGVGKMNSFMPKAQFVRGPSGVYNPGIQRIEPNYTLGDSTQGYTLFVGPADAATIYDTPTSYNAHLAGSSYDGSGITIGVAGDSNIDVAQNANYRATFGLAAKATTVIVDGNDPGENGDAVEAYLDTQVSGGIAPKANVVLYTAANTYFNAGLFLAIIRAMDDNQADILNVSFGGCEAAQGAAGNQFINNLWEQAAAQGISVTVSSGDNGSAGCDDPNGETAAIHGLAVNGLASTPYDIAVGGTDFDVLYSNSGSSFTQYVDVSNSLPNHRGALSYIPEEPWNDSTFRDYNQTISQNVPWYAIDPSALDNIVAGSGGVSSCVQQSSGKCSSGYALPNWQSGFATNVAGRNVPDVSLLAGNGLYGAVWGLCTDQDYDFSTGTLLTDCSGTPAGGNNFNLTGVGGTSAAAPAFAGILALAAQKAGGRIGQADYVLYDLAKSHASTVFHDVATGNNSVSCTAGTPDCAQNTAGYYFMTGYNSGVGYDQASGFGSVDAGQLISNWSNAGLAGTNSTLTLDGGTAAVKITHGAAVSVDANVTGSAGTPSGNVAIVDSITPATLPNSGSIGTFALSAGSATGTTNALPGGSYKVSAHYGGSSTFAGSDSNEIPVTVSAEDSTTALKVVGYFDPLTGKPATTPYYGYIYLIDAQPYGNSASAASPNGAASGSITFKSSAGVLGTAPLGSDGIAELETTTLPGGSDSLTAVFGGDSSFLASTSAPVAFAVTPAVTSLIDSAQPTGVVAGGAVTFNVYLSVDSAGAAPTGTVTFKDGSTNIGSVPLAGVAAQAAAPAAGSAEFTFATFPYGTHSIVANYSGDANYASSSAPATSLTIYALSTSLIVMPPSAKTPVNQPVQVVVEISLGESTSLPGPTGTVTLSFNGQTTSPIPVVTGTGNENASATFTIPANTLPVGTTVVTANYSGDIYYGSSSASGFVNMKNIGTAVSTVTVTAPTSVVNYPVSVEIAVNGSKGNPTPTGSVYLSNGFNYGSPVTSLTNGVAKLTISNGLYPGPNTLTATYQGDTFYDTASGSTGVTLFTTPIISLNPDSPSTVVNQPLTLSVAVGGFGNIGTPTGTVTLSSGTYTSSVVALSGGSASFTIPANSLPVGNDTITASYSGDSKFNPVTAVAAVTVTPAPTPGLAISSTAITVNPGAATGNTSTITVTPSGGFTGSVALTASLTSSPTGAVDLPTLSFGSTSPVSITGAAAGSATLTVSTTASTHAALIHGPGSGTGLYSAGGIALAGMLLVGSSRRRRWRKMLGMMVLSVSLFGGVLACGGGGTGGGGGPSNPGTTAGNYTVTVTGTSGTLTTTTTVTVSVE